MKTTIPYEPEAKGVLAKKLMRYHASLVEYAQSLQQEERRYGISMATETVSTLHAFLHTHFSDHLKAQ